MSLWVLILRFENYCDLTKYSTDYIFIQKYIWQTTLQKRYLPKHIRKPLQKSKHCINLITS